MSHRMEQIKAWCCEEIRLVFRVEDPARVWSCALRVLRWTALGFVAFSAVLWLCCSAGWGLLSAGAGALMGLLWMALWCVVGILSFFLTAYYGALFVRRGWTRGA